MAGRLERAVNKKLTMPLHHITDYRLLDTIQGTWLWKKDNEGVVNPPDMGLFMPVWGFKHIKRFIPIMWKYESCAEEDPWWSFIKAIGEFNKNTKKTVAASISKVFDELMSAWWLQTTATGGLPHPSFVERKPEPLGTEFKHSDSWFASVFTAQTIQKIESCFRGIVKTAHSLYP
eukprot:11332649-Ditylum_brightwellii.AAC.1